MQRDCMRLEDVKGESGYAEKGQGRAGQVLGHGSQGDERHEKERERKNKWAHTQMNK